MRRVLPCLLLCATATVHAKDVSCQIESDYDLSINAQSVILTRDSGTPKWVVIRGERLFVDDRWVALTTEDRRRLSDFDRGVREAMPLAREIGRDAADIAFTALREVAAGFSNDPAQTRARLDQARDRIDARLARSVSANRFDGSDLGKGIGEAVSEVIPLVIGDIVGGAVRAALSGDTRRLEEMENLDKQIEARIEPRANALEKRAEALCGKLEALERLDSALAYRLPAGEALDLLRIKPAEPAK
ncbi:MAG: DUF2884 family protein [Lysobacteraceae bacterium]|nr:MAG: DUF2884 family protein [Xanthomonadaceae bacterium]